MAAKLLHSLADENPDLQKQIGCMTGIFQLFDRHNSLHTKRLPHKRLSAGSSHYNNGGLDRESVRVYYPQAASEMGLNKSASERQRLSTESSRPSFSSSCSSSMSSLECNKNAQPENSSFDRIIFPETPSRDRVMNKAINSPRLGRQSLDLRDVVKDSMHREARGLSVKTTTNEEQICRSMKHNDSPRPVDLKESLRVLAKLREAPWYYNEIKESSKDGSWNSIAKDPPRFSYDGRELNRHSFESRDTIKATSKLKELPRLSLDSRVRSLADSKSNYLSNENQPNSAATRPTSVVAKLMGLEALPDSSNSTENGYLFSQANDRNTPTRIATPPKDTVSPRWKNPDIIMKPISSSKIHTEPAPWKQPDAKRGSQKSVFRPVKVPAKEKKSFPSVYSEIEKRLKDLEFTQSGKDLRALKQILEAMQTKGLLQSKKEEQASNFGTQREYEAKCTSPSHNPRLPSQRNQQRSHSSTSEAPIVIMKPAKLLQKSGLSHIHIIPNGGLSNSKRGSTNNNRISKEQSSRNIRGGGHSSSKSQGGPTEITKSSIKSSGSVSPRLQQNKLELEKRSRPPTPPTESNKPRRQSNRQPVESGSPGRKLKPKTCFPPHNYDQLSQVSSESRIEDDMSVQLGSVISGGSKIDDEVTSAELSAVISGSQSPSTRAMRCSVSSSMQKILAPRLAEVIGLPAELSIVAPEYPSPVSVLDTSLYKDDEPSPVKQTPAAIKVDSARDSTDCSNDGQWSPHDDLLPKGLGSSLSSGINRKKLQNIEHLVEKLRRLNSSHDEARTDYIASLCENTNPDHRYVSEILLASGLLLRDLGSSSAKFQLHSSGYPINPELFFVLEQTKASNEEYINYKSVHLKSDPEKCHRKLIFDAVNEILIEKLDLSGISEDQPWLKSITLAKKKLNAQKLLKELCLEIEQLQMNKPEFCLEEEEEEDSLKSILCVDIMRRTESWTDFGGGLSSVVLDMERSIFKDLVDEIVHGEAADILRNKQGRRRKLFAK
ncbi:hypothetical protein ACFE04_005953 [Oxalis oulophora]